MITGIQSTLKTLNILESSQKKRGSNITNAS